MELAPVALFAYKRKDKVKKCIQSIEQNDECKDSILFVFCDGYKNENDREQVEETKRYVRQYASVSKFKEVHIVESERNKGLATSIIDGVTSVVNSYGKIIVIEDDLILSKYCLKYLNGSLEHYKDCRDIGAISAYIYPLKSLETYKNDVFLMHKGECWGWATWSDRWNNAEWADMDYNDYLLDWKRRTQFEKLEAYFDNMMCAQAKGEIDSWAIRWMYYLFREKKLTVYPKYSLVYNDGMDGSGAHCGETSKYTTVFTEMKNSINYQRYENSDILEKETFQFTVDNKVKYIIKRMILFLKYLELRVRSIIWRNNIGN